MKRQRIPTAKRYNDIEYFLFIFRDEMRTIIINSNHYSWAAIPDNHKMELKNTDTVSLKLSNGIYEAELVRKGK